MTSLELQGRIANLTAGTEVSVRQVEEAVELVIAGGVSSDRIEVFTDKIADAALEGRLPETTRQAYVEGLLRLVNALPDDGSSAVAVRAQRPLGDELLRLEGLITGYEREIQ